MPITLRSTGKGIKFLDVNVGQYRREADRKVCNMHVKALFESFIRMTFGNEENVNVEGKQKEINKP